VAWDPKDPRRTYRGEERFLPLLEEFDLAHIRIGLIRLGISPTLAQGVVFFLDDQRSLDRHQSVTSRCAYRRVLREITPEDLRRASEEGKRTRRELVAS
jgi:hypothetical protein